jgi:hypothetical protein
MKQNFCNVLPILLMAYALLCEFTHKARCVVKLVSCLSRQAQIEPPVFECE